MNSLFKTMHRYAIIRSIAFVLLGIALFLMPNKSFDVLVYLLVGYNFLLGLVNLVGALKNKTSNGMQMPLVVFYFLFAIVLLLFAKPIASIFSIFLGFAIIIGGTTRATQALNLRNKYVNVSWLPMFLFGSILIIAGLVILFKPFATQLLLFRFLGFTMIVAGISELVAFIKLKQLND